MIVKKKSKRKRPNDADVLRPLARQLARKLPSEALEPKPIGSRKYDHLKQETYQGLQEAACMFRDDADAPNKKQLKEWARACKNVR